MISEDAMAIFSPLPVSIAITLSLIWQSGPVFKTPESVFYSKSQNVLYVSNINGSPAARDGNGFISCMSLRGKAIKMDWAVGMDAPKGMGSFGDDLYVTDIERLHRVSLKTGIILKTWKVDGAKSLNDIAVDPSGKIFISDRETSTVFMMKNGKISLWLDLKNYGNANGLAVEKRRLLIGTNQGIISADTITGKHLLLIKHSGGIDGLKPLGEGKYIVTDWKGKTEIISEDSESLVLLDTTSSGINAADIEYIPDMKMLFIPGFMANTVSCYKIN